MDPIGNITLQPNMPRSAQVPEYLQLERQHDPMPLSRERNPMPLADNASGPRDLEARLARARETANSFEAIFIRQLLETMQTSFGGESMFGSGATGELYSDMMNNALADTLSEQGFLGISDMMYRRLIRDISGDTDASETNGSGRTNGLRS